MFVRRKFSVSFCNAAIASGMVIETLSYVHNLLGPAGSSRARIRVAPQKSPHRTPRMAFTEHRRGHRPTCEGGEDPLVESKSSWKDMVRPERFELPAFWFVAQFRSSLHTMQPRQVQQNAENPLQSIGQFCLHLARVYGQKTDSSIFLPVRNFPPATVATRKPTAQESTGSL